jgi:FixJ family two-component response regulator
VPQPPHQTVFVVDDDEAVRDSLRALLECEGLDVAEFASGEQFLASPPRPGCLLVDLHMPGMSAIELIDRLARRGRWPFPAIVISGGADEWARREVARRRAPLLEKPLNHERLLGLLYEVLA